MTITYYCRSYTIGKLDITYIHCINVLPTHLKNFLNALLGSKRHRNINNKKLLFIPINKKLTAYFFNILNKSIFKIPLIGYKWQILSCRSLKILTSQKDAKNFCLLQNKICSLSLNHENLNMLLT